MPAAFDASDLMALGLSERDIQAFQSSQNFEERLRLLRCRRGRLLEEVHAAQQDLDRLDYLIYQLRQGRAVSDK